MLVGFLSALSALHTITFCAAFADSCANPKRLFPLALRRPRGEWTRDGLLRQPVFLGLREDKEPRTVTRERPTHAEDVA